MSRHTDGQTVNINVCENPEPVAELRRIYDATAQTLGYRALQQFSGGDVWQLKVMLNALGFYKKGEVVARDRDANLYTAETVTAVDAFRASEKLGTPQVGGSPAGLVDPEMVSQGGSSLASALGQAVDLARGPTGRTSGAAVVLVSDGEALEEEGFEVTDVDNGEAALAALGETPHQLAFLDIRMPGPSGLELLERLQTLGSDTAVVIITAQNTFENAVEAMKRGALDYLVKPFSVAEVKALAAKAVRTRKLEREVRELRREVGRRNAPGDRLVGRSPELLEIFKS